MCRVLERESKVYEVCSRLLSQCSSATPPVGVLIHHHTIAYSYPGADSQLALVQGCSYHNCYKDKLHVGLHEVMYYVSTIVSILKGIAWQYRYIVCMYMLLCGCRVMYTSCTYCTYW